jgi:CheY-like chemotaxis protein
MNGVIGLTDLVLRTSLDPDQREQLQVVRASGETLLRVINDLLDASKIEAGRLELERVPFDLGDLVRQLGQVHEVLARQKGVRLVVDVDVPRGHGVLGDAIRVRQVLENLLSNALKFTSAGEVRLSVRALGDERYAFAVEDSGIGIPPERLAAIFEPFTQVDGSITRRFGGTGLGLTIASRLVALMGGALAVDSEVGVGSRFHFVAALPHAELAARGPSTAPPPGARALRILAAEDNVVNQKVLARMLATLGHEVVMTGDGEEALEAFGRERFDVALIDLQMPRMDGRAFTRALRAREAEDPSAGHLWVVALTAHAMDDEAEACVEAGMDAFLSKPLTVRALAAALARVPVDGAEPAVEPGAGGEAASGQPASTTQASLTPPRASP